MTTRTTFTLLPMRAGRVYWEHPPHHLLNLKFRSLTNPRPSHSSPLYHSSPIGSPVYLYLQTTKPYRSALLCYPPCPSRQQVISCNKNICTLQITDTTGSHQFPAMQRLSITKGHAFILVYSVCSRQSMEELRPIWTLIKELKPDISQIPVMLVGNKCDESAELREMTATEGQAEAAAWGGGVSFMETSAKTNHNVTELFQVSIIRLTCPVTRNLLTHPSAFCPRPSPIMMLMRCNITRTDGR